MFQSLESPIKSKIQVYLILGFQTNVCYILWRKELHNVEQNFLTRGSCMGSLVSPGTPLKLYGTGCVCVHFSEEWIHDSKRLRTSALERKSKRLKNKNILYLPKLVL